MHQDLFDAYRQGIVGMRISLVWRGHGSAIFLELGDLSHAVRRDGSTGIAAGEYGVMIEWSWRIEDESSILCGSWSDEEKWDGFFSSLIGSSVEELSLVGRLPELSIALSGGIYVSTFMTAEGQPAWTIFDRSGQDGVERWIDVEGGVVCQSETAD